MKRFNSRSDEVKDRKLSKAELGHLKKHEAPASRILREFKKDGEVPSGQTVKVDIFKKGDWVDVIGVSKGKGFQGVVQAAPLCRWTRVSRFHVSSRPGIDRRQLFSFASLEGQDAARTYGSGTGDDTTIKSD